MLLSGTQLGLSPYGKINVLSNDIVTSYHDRSVWHLFNMINISYRRSVVFSLLTCGIDDGRGHFPFLLLPPRLFGPFICLQPGEFAIFAKKCRCPGLITVDMTDLGKMIEAKAQNRKSSE